MKRLTDFKSRFRILKGGKISLVVSALLVSASVGVTEVKAADVTIGESGIDSQSTTLTIDPRNSDTLTVDSGYEIVVDNGTNPPTSAVYIDSHYGPFSITNNGTISTLSNYYNSSTIFADNEGITTGTITNSGTISVTNSGDASAIKLLFSPTESLNIINNAGLITANSTASKGFSGVAIDLKSGLTNGTIINQYSSSSFGKGIVARGDSAIGIRVLNGDVVNSSFYNDMYSNITVTGEVYDSMGVFVQDNVDGSTITNAGTIAVTKTVNSTYSYVSAIKTGNLVNDSNISNSGSITIESHDGNIAGIQSNSVDSTSSITNSNLIDITTTANNTAYIVGIRVGYDDGANSTPDGKTQGTVSNTGEINILNDYNAISIRGIDGAWVDGGTISNADTIYVSGDGYARFLDGIYLREMTTGTVENTQTGTISLNLDAYKVSGIKVNTSFDNNIIAPVYVEGSIVNNGSITINNGKSGRSYSYGINVNSYLINSGNITNDNSINLSVDGVATGITTILMYDDSQILNSGSLTVASTGYAAYGVKIQASLYDNATITNSGTIDVSSVEADGYGIVAGALYNNAKVINENNITVEGSNTNGVNAIGIQFITLENNASITNSGTIDASGKWAYGIVSFGRSGELNTTAKIENTGTIYATSLNDDATGILSLSLFDSASIVNGSASNDTAKIVVRSFDYAYGINSWGKNLYNQASITNYGTIDVASDTGKAAGISGFNMNDDTTLTNGSVENSTAKIVVSGDEAHGIFSYTLEENASITNYGTIATTGTTKSNGIYVQNLRSGSITNETTGIITSNKIGININMMIGGTIENKGEITLNDTSSNVLTGISAYAPSSNGIIINSSTISVTATEDIYALAKGIEVISGSDAYISSIENSGTITVNAVGEGLALHSKAILSDSYYGFSNITNAGTISAYVNGKLDTNAYALHVVNGSDYNDNVSVVNNSGTINGNLYVIGTLNNSGVISLPYNAHPSPENEIFGPFVTTFNQSSTGVLQIGLLTDGETTTHSKLTTTDATFANGSTIDVNVLAASTNVTLLDGTTLNDVVSASNSLTIDGTLNVTDNSTLLNFEYDISDNDGTLDLNVVQAKTIVDSTVLGNGNTNAQSLARTLLTENAQNSGMISYLNTLQTDEQVANALETVAPNVQAAENAKIQVLNNIQGIVDMRQRSTFESNNETGSNSGDTLFADKNVWLKPFGTWGKQNDKNGMAGFDLKAYGIGAGVDTEYAENQRAGLAFFYTNASLDVNNLQKESDIDVYTLMTYGSVPVLDAKTKFLYQLGYSWQKTNNESILGANKVKSDYTAKTTSLDLKLMRDYQINSNWLVQPTVEMTYRNSKTPAYSETGIMTVNIDKFNTTQLIAGLGAISHYKLDDKSKVITSLNLGYDLHDRENTVIVNGGAPIEGIDNGRWTYKAGVGYEMNLSDVSNVNVMYEREGQGSDFTSNTISAKYVYKF